MERKIKRGDIFYADLASGVGSEQSGYRPVLIIQNDIGNKYSGTTIIAVITSRVFNKSKLPTHCYIKAQQQLERDSIILLEQIRTVDKRRLGNNIGTLDYSTMQQVDKSLAISIELNKFI